MAKPSKLRPPDDLGPAFSAEKREALPPLRSDLGSAADPFRLAQEHDARPLNASERAGQQGRGSAMIKQDRIGHDLRPPEAVRRAADRRVFVSRWLAEQRDAAFAKRSNKISLKLEPPANDPKPSIKEHSNLKGAFDMSDQQKNAPVATHRDAAVSVKVWRNFANDGRPFYSTTFQRTYTDKATNEPREANSFQGTDVLKVQQLAAEAYQTINRLREADRANAPTQQQAPAQNPEQQPTQNNGLAQQRDNVMNDPNVSYQAPQPGQNHEPQR